MCTSVQTAPLKVAIYCRTAVVDPARPSLSVEAQEDAGREWCRDNLGDTQVAVSTYIDTGCSSTDGWDAEARGSRCRPGLARLVEQLGADQVDILVVSGVDRIARSPLLLHQFTETFVTGKPVRLVDLREGKRAAGHRQRYPLLQMLTCLACDTKLSASTVAAVRRGLKARRYRCAAPRPGRALGAQQDGRASVED
ncbi:MAG: recombinase family protein [Armatimonadota bacterium]